MRGQQRWSSIVAVARSTGTIGRNARPVLIGDEAQALLHVVGEEEEDAEHARAADADGQVGAAAVAVGDDAQRQQRVLDPALQPTNTDEQHGAARRGRRR